MTLRNADMWHDLRNGIIMRDVIYAEWRKEMNSTKNYVFVKAYLTFPMIMPFRKSYHMPCRKLIPLFTLPLSSSDEGNLTELSTNHEKKGILNNLCKGNNREILGNLMSRSHYEHITLLFSVYLSFNSISSRTVGEYFTTRKKSVLTQ